jgi:hypothetical protein
MAKDKFFTAYLISSPIETKKGLVLYRIDKKNKKLILKIIREIWKVKSLKRELGKSGFVLDKKEAKTFVLDLPAGYTKKETINLGTGLLIVEDGVLMKQQALGIEGDQKSKLIYCKREPGFSLMEASFDKKIFKKTGEEESINILQNLKKLV